MPLWSSPVAVIPVGWPRGRYGPTTRPPVSEYVHYDTYGNRSRPAAAHPSCEARVDTLVDDAYLDELRVLTSE
jgi:hypothetical protein